MTLVIELTAEQESRLVDRAANEGRDPTDYARALIERGLLVPAFDEVAAPLRQEFEQSGMSEEALEGLIGSARNAAYRDRHPEA